MELIDVIEKIDRLKGELDALLPMSKENEERLWKKIRLDWNYNSNHIEGNTLTYGETKLLLLFDKVTGNHDAREIEEMKGHDVALHIIREMAEDKERPLTESFIKELNKIILVKPFWKEAITPDGQSTRRLIKVGDYKEFANSVRLQNGEMFNYADPIDVPAKMEELMAFYRKHKKDTKTHPLQLAAIFHYDFVRIHPFDDGNGRVSRLLMNYILMRKGYPPVIIQSKDKSNYLFALNKADTGDVEAFIVYIGEQLIRSLEMSIKTAKGKDIEEDDDVDKELELVRRKLASNNKEIKIKKSITAIIDYLENNIIPFAQKVINDSNINSFFIDAFCDLYLRGNRETEFAAAVPEEEKFSIIPEYEDNIKDSNFFLLNNYSLGIVELRFTWKGLKHNANSVETYFSINFDFQEYRIILFFGHPNKKTEILKLYDETITEEEQKQIRREIKTDILYFVKQQENT